MCCDDNDVTCFWILVMWWYNVMELCWYIAMIYCNYILWICDDILSLEITMWLVVTMTINIIIRLLLETYLRQKHPSKPSRHEGGSCSSMPKKGGIDRKTLRFSLIASSMGDLPVHYAQKEMVYGLPEVEKNSLHWSSFVAQDESVSKTFITVRESLPRLLKPNMQPYIWTWDASSVITMTTRCWKDLVSVKCFYFFVSDELWRKMNSFLRNFL